MRLRQKSLLTAVLAVSFLTMSPLVISSADAAFQIDRASWNDERNHLRIRGEGDSNQTVTVTNAGTGALIGTDEVNNQDWRVRVRNLASVPCTVSAVQSDGQSEKRAVRNAPANCNDGGGYHPNHPVVMRYSPPQQGGGVSINSFSQRGQGSGRISEQPLTGQPDYVLFSANDLGMHGYK